MKENFIYDQLSGRYSLCYSSNLHSNDNAEPEKWTINSTRRARRNRIGYIRLKIPTNESFIYISLPKVFFSVHSPFIPENPRILQNELQIGHKYEIDVHLKEERLLQHPFPTDCTDYVELWRKNNKTGPRSQEACKKKCSDVSEEQCWNCTLWKKVKCKETCMRDCSFCEKMYLEELPSCEMKCKVSCFDTIHIYLYMDNTEVEVLKHNRLYGTEELFSYIGGLMGCWLGISVWASVSLFENIYRKIVQVKRLLRKK
ncbi:uncharacterized protein TNCT_315651 [Trichonephila clavata]|uniref:Uncharacterized protein n=1 Tax=Trichonephila clavata TaxID=2740835 RepID=A0A8X6GW05_TRICU|nr:uncharacterized protein TNCT_315651 [Trichonephila clavata]